MILIKIHIHIQKAREPCELVKYGLIWDGRWVCKGDLEESAVADAELLLMRLCALLENTTVALSSQFA